MKTFSKTCCTLVLVLTSATLAFAQAGAPIKARGAFGEGFWEASKRQQHAQDHAQILYNYGQAQQPVAVEKVKEHSTAIRQNVTASQKALAEAKKAFADNKDVQAAVAKIESIHKKVGAHCDLLDAQAGAARTDNVAIHACCADIYHDIAEADAELAKLMKSLKIAPPAPPKKAPAATQPEKK